MNVEFKELEVIPGVLSGYGSRKTRSDKPPVLCVLPLPTFSRKKHRRHSIWGPHAFQKSYKSLSLEIFFYFNIAKSTAKSK